MSEEKYLAETKIGTINATVVLLLRIRLGFPPLRGHESLFTASIETFGGI